MKLQINLLMLLSLVVSCARDWTIPIQTAEKQNLFAICIDASVSANQIPGIISAVSEWKKSLAIWRTVVVKCPGNVVVMNGSCEGTGIACANALGGDEIHVLNDANPNKVAVYVSHELGHIFGAQHTSIGLMASSYYNQHVCPDELTIKQVAAYNHINADLLSFCY